MVLQLSLHLQPLGCNFIHWICLKFLQLSSPDVTNNIKAALLDVINEVHQVTGVARVGYHKEDLRSPVFDMWLAWVQHKQIFAYLSNKAINSQRLWMLQKVIMVSIKILKMMSTISLLTVLFFTHILSLTPYLLAHLPRRHAFDYASLSKP